MAFEAVEAYERLIGRWSRAAAPAFVDFAQLGDAADVLDVGCGTGALVAALAERLPGASITGVDREPACLQACRAAWPAPRCRFVQGDAAALPLTDANVDAVLSMLLLMLVPDPARVAAETRRVLRPGGTAAAATWDDERFELIREFWDEAREVDPQAPSRDGRTHCVRPGELRALWQSSGFTHVTEDQLQVEMRFGDVDEIWSALDGGVGPAGTYVRSLDPSSRDRLRRRLARRWSPSRRPGLRFGARLLVVRGTPGSKSEMDHVAFAPPPRADRSTGGGAGAADACQARTRCAAARD
jgi:ubiquinone/menaquinone biosynthesis C-methylase UbiE